MKRSILLWVFCLAGVAAFAQQPVQITTLLRPPYTLQLSDYYASTQEKLVVVLTNRDLNKPVLQVRLRMRIESQTVQLRSRDFAAFPILSLEAGVPLRLSLSDLAAYFHPDNLDFAGITRAQYLQQAKLPEGFYQFCFEAIEVSTNQVASARSCGMAWISLSDPPLLNIPRKGESIAMKEPQNIIFQWTPRHLNSPNSAFATEYDFQLVEIWDNSLAPEVAFQSMQPLYEVTTRTTTLLYGPSQPLLMAGKRYAWRVRARVQNGVEASDVFRNQGYSEIYWFTFQDVCPPPTGVSATNGTFGNLEFSWVPNSRHTGYMVTYREKDKDGAVWFDQQSASTVALVYDVQPGKTYEYRIGGFCTTDQPVFSEIHTVAIPARAFDAFVNCRIVPDPQITNQQPLTTLQPGDVITAGDFPVRLSNVGGAGSFSGRGYVVVPFLGKAKVHVVFDDIQVNTDKQLIAGMVITSYDDGEGSVIDVDEGLDIFRGYQGIVSRLQGFTADTDRDELEKVLDRVVENAEKELPPEEVTKVKNNVDELLIAKDTYDETKEAYDALPEGDPAKEALGKEVAEAKQHFGEVKNRFDGADKDAVMDDTYTLKFDRLYEQTVYGWDAYDRTRNASNYEKLSQRSVDEYISWKAVPQGGFDWVQVGSKGTDELPDSVFFRSATGTIEAKEISEYIMHLKVYGYGAGETNPVFAYEEKKVDGKSVNIARGKVNVVSYPKMYRKLVLVPVNDEVLPGSREDIEKGLNKIYGQAVVEWNVVVSQPLRSQYDLNNNGMDENKEQVYGLYSSEMKQVLNDFVLREPFDPEVHYMFLVSESENNRLSGYNPFKRQAGFVFMHEQARTYLDDFINTLAHEMGHGAFRLVHTFDGLLGRLPQGSTNNLMDYGSGSALDKYQWDIIHDPPFMLSLFGDTNGQLPSDIGAPDIAAVDPFTNRMISTLKEYKKNVEEYTGGNGTLTACFEGHKKQVTSILQDIDDILADKDTVQAFALDVKDEVFNLTDDDALKSAVCSSLTKRLQSFELLFVYNDVQYKDGESIYITGAASEVKLRIISDDPAIVLDAETVTWEGATGTGKDAVVAANTKGDKAVTVSAESVKATVTIKQGSVKLTADKFFAPTQENLDITYDVEASTSGEWKYAKLEVFAKDNPSPVYTDNTVASRGQGIKISWDGKMNAGTNKDYFITIYESPYTVKVSVGMDEKFSDSYSDEKQVSVEVESVTLTPDGTLSLLKPARDAEKILQDVEALVKIRNKKGEGVATALPVMLMWKYEDPDDVANDAKRIIDINGPAGNDNTSVADGGKVVTWEGIEGYPTRPIPKEAMADVSVEGENKGKSKITFSSSVIAGDNYIIVAEVVDKANNTLKGISARTGIWTVRKKVTNENIYEMPGSFNMTQVMRKENIDPAFSKDGCTDYFVGDAVIKLPESTAREFLSTVLVPDSVTEMPTAKELADFSFGRTAAIRAAAEDTLRKKALHWYHRNDENNDDQLIAFAEKQGIKRQSIVSIQYLHPKTDGNKATGKTDYYPPGLTIDIGDPGYKSKMVDPDEEWTENQALEMIATKIAWFFKNIDSDKRRQIVARHEIGHRSDHKPFGNTGDHAVEGLMTPVGGMTPTNPVGDPEFSASSINKLRGRKR